METNITKCWRLILKEEHYPKGVLNFLKQLYLLFTKMDFASQSKSKLKFILIWFQEMLDSYAKFGHQKSKKKLSSLWIYSSKLKDSARLIVAQRRFSESFSVDFVIPCTQWKNTPSMNSSLSFHISCCQNSTRMTLKSVHLI